MPRFLEKVWGSTQLSPWFPDSEKKIGEAWLGGPEGEPLAILIKFLFTTEPLSVQVHPNDEYAWKHHKSRGKTEMWYILRAEPGAQIALGLKEAMTADELRAACESGSIVQKLNWIDAHPGDTFLTPAGTIHAIGAGLALCEIQQQSDVTYRLYDYGRPRELHLDQGIAVSHLDAFRATPQPAGCLADCPYFRTERLALSEDTLLAPFPNQLSWLICVDGEGAIDGDPYRAGQGWNLIAGVTPVRIHPSRPSVFLKTFVPAQAQPLS